MTTKIAPRRVEHPAKGRPEYEGDSVRAILHAAKNGIPWIDNNWLLTKDNVVVAQHWDLPLLHGWHVEPGSPHIDPHTRQSEMTWEQTQTLVSNHGKYKVHTALDLVKVAHHHGVKTEGELKCFIPHSILLDLHNKVPEPDEVQIKTMMTKPPQPWERLRIAHEVGWVTIALCHEKNIAVPERAQTWINYYRGYAPRFV